MTPLTRKQIRRARRWMTMVLLGLFIFLIGVRPNLIGMDRSPVVGFVQIGVWLTGLAILLLGAYATVHVIRNGIETSLRADIGIRLIATGYVIAGVASLADFIGVGAQRMPNIAFGPVQVIGLAIGVLVSLLGLILYWPLRKERQAAAASRDVIKDEEPANQI
jgi:ABC-type Co2+ transport system permease subunit